MAPGNAFNLLVVARFVNGRILKGTTRDFSPQRPSFHLHPEGDARAGAVQVPLVELKAAFFVRSLEGDRDHVEEMDFLDKGTQGRRVRVTFKDSETLVGTTVGYTPDRAGFFLLPADPESNNLRVFVVSASVSKVEFLPIGEKTQAGR